MRSLLKFFFCLFLLCGVLWYSAAFAAASNIPGADYLASAGDVLSASLSETAYLFQTGIDAAENYLGSFLLSILPDSNGNPLPAQVSRPAADQSAPQENGVHPAAAGRVEAAETSNSDFDSLLADIESRLRVLDKRPAPSPSSSAASETALEKILSELQSAIKLLEDKFAQNSPTPPIVYYSAPYTPSTYQTAGIISGAASPYGDFAGGISTGGNLSAAGNVTLGGSGKTVTIATTLAVNGVSGLTDADIPDTITASNYLPLTGGVLTGAVTISSGGLGITGDLTVNGNTIISSGSLNVGDKVIAPGDIGVGTSTPGGKLAIQSTSAATTTFLLYGTSTQSAPLINVYDNPLANNNLLRLTSAGLFGLGTSTPSSLLSVQGNGLFSGSLNVAGSSGLTVQSGGNVGIGTTTPGTKLGVQGDIVGAGQLTVSSLTATSTIATSTFSGGLIVGSNNLWVSPSGNVGIGTANPGAVLEVNGNIILSSGSDRTISIPTPSNVNANANSLTISAANGPSNGFGGNLTLNAGNACTNCNGFGGNVSINAGNGGNGGRDAGSVTITAGSALNASPAGNISLIAGNTNTAANGGGITLRTGTAVAPGTMSFQIGGANTKMFIDSSGLVGIGTTTPASLLSVQGNGLFSGNISVANVTATGTVLGTGGLRLGTSTSIQNSIGAIGAITWGSMNSSGGNSLTFSGFTDNIVINNTLQLGANKIQGPDSSRYIQFNSATGQNDTPSTLFVGGQGQDPGNPVFRFWDNGTYTGHRVFGVGGGTTYTEYLTIKNDGTVGIATSTPSSLLSVQGNGLFSGNLNVAGLTATGTVNFTGSTATTTISGGLNAGGSSGLYVLQNGNVGIGTANPSALLHVFSSTSQTMGMDISDSATGGQTIVQSRYYVANVGNNSTGLVRLYGPNHATEPNTFEFSNDSGNINIAALSQTAGTGVIRFTTGLSEKMRIINNGNVGIGTTTPNTLFQVEGANNANWTQLAQFNAGNAGAVGAGAMISIQPSSISGRYDGARIYGGRWIDNRGLRIAAVPWSNVAVGSETLYMDIGTDASGNNGSFKLLGGNLGIGTTSPQSKLSVNGGAVIGTYYTAAPTNGLLVEGNVGIGTTTPWRTLSVNGTVGFAGLGSSGGTLTLCLDGNNQVVTNNGACTGSSELFKHDISALDVSGTSTVEALVPSSFIYNNDTSSTTRWGFIADQIASVSPTFIDYFDPNTHRPLTINTTSILSITVKAVKELIAEVGNLADTVAGFAEEFTTKILNAGQVNTDKLCVQDVCVTRDQFLQMVKNAAVQPEAAPADSPTPTPTATPTPSPTDVVASPTPTPDSMDSTGSPPQASAPEVTPTPEATPTPEPTPTDASSTTPPIL